MNDDRSYYRMLPDLELIRLASAAPTELALVLAERLTEVIQLEEAHDTALAVMENTRDEEAAEMANTIDDLTNEVTFLKKVIEDTQASLRDWGNDDDD